MLVQRNEEIKRNQGRSRVLAEWLSANEAILSADLI